MKLRRMKKAAAAIGMVLSLSAMSAGVYADDDAANAYDPALLAQVDAFRAPAGNFRFRATVTSPESTNMEMTVLVRDRTKSLVRYSEPEELRGWVLLFVNHKMWLHTPDLKKPLRILPRQRMLAGVWAADVARLVYGLDYAVRDMGPAPTPVGPGTQRRLRLEATGEGAAYSRIELDVLGSEMLPMKSVSFTEEEGKVKTVYFGVYRKTLGHRLPMRLRVMNHLEDDTETHLRFHDFEPVDAPTDWFKLSYMKKLVQSPAGI